MKNKTQLTMGLTISCIAVAGLCLGVSLFQAASYVLRNVPNSQQAWVIVMGIAAALLTSQLLVRMFVPLMRSQKKGWAWLVAIGVAVFTVGVIETFSISTSTTAFDGGLIEARRTQNLDSPERKQLEKQAERLSAKLLSIDDQVAALETERNEMPADWATRKEKVEKRIDQKEKEARAIEYKLGKLNDAINTVDVSTSGAAFDRMEKTIGVSQTDVALIFALLMTLCPIAVNLVAGTLSTSNAPGGGSAASKKPKNQPAKPTA